MNGHLLPIPALPLVLNNSFILTKFIKIVLTLLEEIDQILFQNCLVGIIDTHFTMYTSE